MDPLYELARAIGNGINALSDWLEGPFWALLTQWLLFGLVYAFLGLSGFEIYGWLKNGHWPAYAIANFYPKPDISGFAGVQILIDRLWSAWLGALMGMAFATISVIAFVTMLLVEDGRRQRGRK